MTACLLCIIEGTVTKPEVSATMVSYSYLLLSAVAKFGNICAVCLVGEVVIGVCTGSSLLLMSLYSVGELELEYIH